MSPPTVFIMLVLPIYMPTLTVPGFFRRPVRESIPLFNHKLGKTVAISEDYAVAGVPQCSYVEVWERDGAGWAESSNELTSVEVGAGYYYGNAVAVNGSKLAITDNGGGVYLFEHPQTGWDTANRTHPILHGRGEFGFDLRLNSFHGSSI